MTFSLNAATVRIRFSGIEFYRKRVFEPRLQLDANVVVVRCHVSDVMRLGLRAKSVGLSLRAW